MQVVSRHEFDSHAFPKSGRVGVPSPADDTLRTLVLNVSRSWFERGNDCANKKRSGKGEKCNEGKHIRSNLVERGLWGSSQFFCCP